MPAEPGPPLGHSSLRLTFAAGLDRSFQRTYETSLKEALAEFAGEVFKSPEETGDPSSDGPERWVFGIIVERNGNEFTPEEEAAAFRELSALANFRAEESRIGRRV